MFEKLHDITNGDQQKARRYIKMYETIMAKKMTELSKAINNNNLEQIHSILHDCKLMLSTVGLDTYYQEAEMIEKDIRAGDQKEHVISRANVLLGKLQKVQENLTV